MPLVLCCSWKHLGWPGLESFAFDWFPFQKWESKETLSCSSPCTGQQHLVTGVTKGRQGTRAQKWTNFLEGLKAAWISLFQVRCNVELGPSKLTLLRKKAPEGALKVPMYGPDILFKSQGDYARNKKDLLTYLLLPIASLLADPFPQPPLQPTPQTFGCSKLQSPFVPTDALSTLLELGLCLFLAVFSGFLVSVSFTSQQSSFLEELAATHTSLPH